MADLYDFSVLMPLGFEPTEHMQSIISFVIAFDAHFPQMMLEKISIISNRKENGRTRNHNRLRWWNRDTAHLILEQQIDSSIFSLIEIDFHFNDITVMCFTNYAFIIETFLSLTLHFNQM